MKTTLTKKRAISTILTTVIILVASVVLGSGVVLYGTSLFQGSTLTENITVSGTLVWVDPDDPNGHAWGASGLRNSGDRAISVDKISVRGVDVPFTDWFVTIDQTEATVANIQASFNHTRSYDTDGEMADSLVAVATGNCLAANADNQIIMDLDGAGTTNASMCLERQSGPIGLDPGDRAVVYFKMINGTLNPIDAGSTTSVNIFSGKAGAPLSLTIGKP